MLQIIIYIYYVSGERKDISQVANTIYDAICKSPRMVVLQDIICSRRDPSSVTALARLEERLKYERYNAKKSEFVMFSWHGLDGFQHYHAYHMCTYRKSYCCCSIVRNQNAIGNRRRTVPKSTLSKEDIVRILTYHRTKGREIRFLSIEGEKWIHVTSGIDNTDGQSIPEGFMEICNDESSTTGVRGRTLIPDGVRHESGNSRDSHESKRHSKDNWIDLVYTFVSKHVTVPVRNALCLNEWRSLPNHLLINKQSYKISNVIEDIEFKYLSFTVRDFYDLYTNSEKIIYFKALTIEEYDRKYLALRESLISIMELLYFQFEYNWEKVDKFLLVINNMCDFKQYNVKKNSLWVKSPNSAGKNYFFDALCDSFILVGQVKNPIRNYTFGFMNCVNKRVLQWNEALVDPYFYEDVKPILAGDSPNVQVKNRDDGVVRATPVFILSNRLSFPDTSEFNCRLHKYEWDTCPLLKLYRKKPDPRSVNMLLMATADFDNLVLADKELYCECKKIVTDIVDVFGKEYYKNNDYKKMMKNSNKEIIIYSLYIFLPDIACATYALYQVIS